MKMRLLRVDDHKVMPWKNGQGVTREIAVHPEGATLEGGFVWRISSADVGASGPFSVFPGIDRTILVLSGGGMALESDAFGRRDMSMHLDPFDFDGGANVNCTLTGEPLTDFNVMTRRDAATSETAILRLRQGEQGDAMFEGQWGLLFVVQGAVRVCPLNGDEASHTVRMGETLLLEGEEKKRLLIEGIEGEAALVAVEIALRK